VLKQVLEAKAKASGTSSHEAFKARTELASCISNEVRKTLSSSLRFQMAAGVCVCGEGGRECIFVCVCKYVSWICLRALLLPIWIAENLQALKQAPKTGSVHDKMINFVGLTNTASSSAFLASYFNQLG